MNVLILNIFNVFQEQDRWSGRLQGEDIPRAPGAASFEDVVELLPKNGVWEAANEEMPSLEPPKTRVRTCERVTYNSRGGYTPASTVTGARINLVA